MPRPPLTDEEVHEALVRAGDLLRGLSGQTIRGQTTIEAAQAMLALLSLGLVGAMEANADRNLAIRDDAEF